MKINFHRHHNPGSHDAWKECQFTSGTDLSALTIRSLVTINGQPVLQQHHATYLTGKETSRAHHFAKYLAIQVFKGKQGKSNEEKGNDAASEAPTVLWIDTVHGPHISAQLFKELQAHAVGEAKLHLACLDVLGDERNNFYALNRRIEELIDRLEPTLVVIDDIDHFMPFCGVNVATEFCRIVRDVLNHTETSFLFVGYNNLSKKAATTGNLGKYLFIDATDVFTVSTQRNLTTVRYVRGFDLSNDPDATQFHFTIGPDNLPHPAQKAPAVGSIMDSDVLARCITDVLQPGQTITPDELVTQITARHRQLKHQARSRAILNQALNLDLIKKEEDTQNYALFNTSLTLPPHPSVEVLQASGLHTTTNKKASAHITASTCEQLKTT